MALNNKELLTIFYCFPSLEPLVTFVKILGIYHVSDKDCKGGGESLARAGELLGQFLVKFSTSGGDVVQDYLFEPGLKEGVCSGICYYPRPQGSIAMWD